MDKPIADMPGASMPDADFDAALRAAGNLHRGGKLDEAERRYRMLLARRPRHGTLLHAAGLCALQQGLLPLALERLSQAIEHDATDPTLHSNHGLALQASGRHEAALAAYRRALALDPSQPDALFNLGGVLMQLHQPQAALDAYERLLLTHPHHIPTLLRRSAVLRALGRADEALAACGQARALAPDDQSVCLEWALVLRDTRQFADALTALARVLAHRPDHPFALWQQGLALRALGRHEAALQSYDHALAAMHVKPGTVTDPGLEAALRAGRANVLSDLGRAEAALAGYDQALALIPEFADAWSNRSGVLAGLARFGEALASATQALALQPDHRQAALHRANALREIGQGAAALQAYEALLAPYRGHAHEHSPDRDHEAAAVWFNRALTLSALARYREARSSYAEALALTPDDADLRWNAALCDLLLGDYAAGWRGYEARWDSARLKVPRRPFARMRWLGDGDPRGKRLLLHAEQGLGDTLQFFRYVPLLVERGARIVLEVQPVLRRLFEQQRDLLHLPGLVQVLAQGEVLPDFDLHCPLPSLPLACIGTHPAPLAQIPYLKADPALCAKWSARLAGVEAKSKAISNTAYIGATASDADRPPRIGVAWRGSGSQARDPRRLPLAYLATLSSLPAHFIGLQVDHPAEEAELAGLTRFDGDLIDFAETAALIAQLDLVISIDTSVVHLAGALGCPVWVLLPFNADWRWLAARCDSPWYPGARLFRQIAPGQWSGVIDAVRGALQTEWLAGRHAVPPAIRQLELHKKSD
jgi:tetratricopeptide (TPR) repeat protein